VSLNAELLGGDQAPDVLWGMVENRVWNFQTQRRMCPRGLTGKLFPKGTRMKNSKDLIDNQVKLTKKQIAEYLKNGGTKCPICLSENIESDRVDMDGSRGTANVSCNHCGLTWTDIVKLAGLDVDNVFQGNIK